jgi:hypothetical protein
MNEIKAVEIRQSLNEVASIGRDLRETIAALEKRFGAGSLGGAHWQLQALEGRVRDVQVKLSKQIFESEDS